MTLHERERLSAWLDGELPPAERAEVEAHLAACEECAALLANLEAVDDLAREIPAEAPTGYFEMFPERVRARVETATGGRPGVRWRPPVWTWAAAAVLLLAVVTPLTLDRLDRDPSPPPRPDTVAQAPKDTSGRAARSSDMAEQDEAAGADRDRAREAVGKRETGLGRRLEEPASEPEPAFAAAPGPEPIGAVASRRQTPARAPEAFPPAPAVPAPRQSRAPEEWADAPFPDAAAAPAEGEALEETLAAAPGSRSQLAKDDVVAQGVVGPAKGQVATPQAAGRQEGFAAAEKKTVPEDALPFARLVGAAPSDTTAWREHREEWRAFVAAYPRSRRADEARVRVIEAGLEAWRTGANPEDLARARADGEAYLARDDAEQKERVLRALQTAPESPR